MVAFFAPIGWSSEVLPVEIEMISTGTGVAASGAYTFAGQAIGGPAPDRWVIVAVTAESNAAISSVSVAGMAAEAVAGPRLNSGVTPSISSAIYRARVPSGSVADIVVQMDASPATRIGITIFRLTGGRGAVDAAATIPPSDQSGGGTGDFLFSAPAGSGTIVVCGINGTSSAAWSGITQVSNFIVGGDRHASALRIDAEDTPLTIGNNAGVNRSMSAAVFA